MSWSLQKKNSAFFETFILFEGNFAAFVFYLSVYLLNKLSEYTSFYISKIITSYALLLVFKIAETCFKSFEKMKVISLYWFAAQQQTGTFRRQIFGLFYLEFTAEFNELTVNV